MLKNDLILVIALGLIVAMCSYAGYKFGKLEFENSFRERELEAIKQLRDVDEEIDKLSRDDIISQLRTQD